MAEKKRINKMMEGPRDVNKILKDGMIRSELELERALVAERKLMMMEKEDTAFRTVRKKLRDIIEAYENRNWSATAEISQQKINESDVAGVIAEMERAFIMRRKKLILGELIKHGLTQQDFGKILGHNNKSYISELMNGVAPFTLKDLVIIHRLLQIELKALVPVFIAEPERKRIYASIEGLGNTGLTLNSVIG